MSATPVKHDCIGNEVKCRGLIGTSTQPIWRRWALEPRSQWTLMSARVIYTFICMFAYFITFLISFLVEANNFSLDFSVDVYKCAKWIQLSRFFKSHLLLSIFPLLSFNTVFESLLFSFASSQKIMSFFKFSAHTCLLLDGAFRY